MVSTIDIFAVYLCFIKIYSWLYISKCFGTWRNLFLILVAFRHSWVCKFVLPKQGYVIAQKQTCAYLHAFNRSGHISPQPVRLHPPDPIITLSPSTFCQPSSALPYLPFSSHSPHTPHLALRRAACVHVCARWRGGKAIGWKREEHSSKELHLINSQTLDVSHVSTYDTRIND